MITDINMERNVGYNIVYLQMNCSKTKEKTAEQTCTGSSLCIKVHNGGLVAAPGELEGFWTAFKKRPNPQTALWLYLLS